MTKKIYAFLIGAIVGAAILAIAAYQLLPGMMIMEDKSQYGFEQTIEEIERSAKENNWKTPAVHHLHKAVAGAGYNVLPAAVIELCQPKHAGKILANPDNRVVTSLMPCRVAVYEMPNGDVIISRMNSGLVASVFGGQIAKVMKTASRETEALLADSIQ
ncbi:MAG: DUF302 domain-containing protein [Thiohalophilus sp.]|uniref:DUF302 domain-containing protein n=1 Tax=Thiohalophilus sp. TaxID=3028392 RepID=UPI002870A323|nr:DUF302 domain-containing protein [Thiohalophilus sp.]MDR9436151.1 DUF302 domain-containing protein [Thiohalophilus sp.]